MILDEELLYETIEKYTSEDALIHPPTEVDSDNLFSSGILQGRLQRAATDEAIGDSAQFSRYFIWASTIRGILTRAIEGSTLKQELVQAVNSLACFCEIPTKLRDY